MQEKFYGPWTIQVSGFGPRLRFRLTGTDSSDGFHIAESQPYVLDVTGDAWTFLGQSSKFGDNDWARASGERTRTFHPSLGLTLRVFYDFLALSDHSLHPIAIPNELLLDCVCRDPELAPVPAPPPPDFTVPGPGDSMDDWPGYTSVD
ncbi:hypothetical protein [Aeromicrobium sp.]|uniref:hypothetical protein n=1 Tax=Aeromicrobium sp. TaxID=1871063 RepID=UPI003D6A4182